MQVHSIFCSAIDFNEFLDIIIDEQGQDRDIYDEIAQGFKLFDTGTNDTTVRKQQVCFPLLLMHVYL